MTRGSQNRNRRSRLTAGNGVFEQLAEAAEQLVAERVALALQLRFQPAARPVEEAHADLGLETPSKHCVRLPAPLLLRRELRPVASLFGCRQEGLKRFKD